MHFCYTKIGENIICPHKVLLFYDTIIHSHAYTEMNRTRTIYILSSAILLLIFILYLVRTASEGREIFLREGCADCHSFKGHGGELAPDLTAVGKRRSTLWIISQIKDPRSHNPASRMPGFAHLSFVERYAISLYLKN